jgi:hypothetical protein
MYRYSCAAAAAVLYRYLVFSFFIFCHLNFTSAFPLVVDEQLRIAPQSADCIQSSRSASLDS